MKIALMVGEVAEHTSEFMTYLQQNGYTLIKTDNPDEIDQIGQQSGMALLIFSDPAWAYKFLSEFNWSFPTLNAVYVHKRPIVHPEIQKKLTSKSLKLFHPSIKHELLAIMNGFKAFIQSSDEGVTDIEFSVHEDLTKEEPQ